MKFSNNFIGILKQFQKISDQIYFIKGNTQSTISSSGRVFAQATSDVELDKPFAVYSLKKLLAVLSLYKEPNIIINDNDMEISSEDNRKICKYQLTMPECIVYDKNPERFGLMQKDITFSMLEADYIEAIALARVLNSDLIVFLGDGERIRILTEKKQAGDVGKVELGETDQVFRASLLTEIFDIMKGDYMVTISKKGAISFVSETISYFFAVEKAHSSL